MDVYRNSERCSSEDPTSFGILVCEYLVGATISEPGVPSLLQAAASFPPSDQYTYPSVNFTKLLLTHDISNVSRVNHLWPSI